MKRKIFYGIILLIVIFAVEMIFAPKVNAYTATEIGSKLNQIRNTSGYRPGEKYIWNDSGYSSDYCSLGTAWNGAHTAWQCHAYGMDLFENIFHQCANCMPKSYDVYNLYVGDLVRVDNDGHTILVTDIVGDTVYYTDANWGFTGQTRWDVTISKADLANRLTFIRHANGNDVRTLQGDSEAPKVTYVGADIKTMTSNSMNIRAWASDNVGVTKVQIRIWRSGYSADSGTTKTATYRSSGGYWEANFTESDIKKGNTGGVVCVEAWAYDAKNNKSAALACYNFAFGGKKTGLGSFKARIVPNTNTNYCIGISGTNNGDDLQLKTKNTTDKSQIWEITELSDGFYKIINVSTNKSMDIDGGSGIDYNGGVMQLWSYSSSAPQHKYLIQSYNGGYRIVPVNSGSTRGIDIPSGDIKDGQKIQEWNAENSNNAAQTFIFEKVATSLSINTTSTNITQGNSTTLSATIKPTDVSIKNLTWTSSNSSVATVTQSGKVTAVKPGTATITAKTKDGTNISATCKVQVLEKSPFTDVSTNAWYYDAVKYTNSQKIMSGYGNGKFGPEDKLTRGMVVTMLHTMAGSPYVTGQSKFSDVKNTNAYYYNAIKWAANNGIVSGYGNGKFGPEDKVTREQFAVMLNNYCVYRNKYKKLNGNLNQFKDSAKISSYAKNALNWATGAGVITGNNGNINPKGTTTRAEAASMIYKYCIKVGK